MNQHLKKIIKELKSIELLETHLFELEELKIQYENRLEELSGEIEAKNSKISKLDKSNFKTIYLKLTGNLDLKLELYQNHYLDLALEHKDLVKTMELIDFEIEIVISKLKSLEKSRIKFQSKVKTYKEGALNHSLIEYRTCLLYTSPSPRDRG